MILHEGIFLVFALFYTQLGRSNEINDKDTESSEDDKLKQALILVELLKDEYFKVLRENVELRKEKAPTPAEETCAPTLEPGNTTVPLSDTQKASSLPPPTPGPAALPAVPQNIPNANPLPPSALNLDKTQLQATAQPLLAQNALNRERFYRRRIPDYYYYYGFPAASRRFLHRPPMYGLGNSWDNENPAGFRRRLGGPINFRRNLQSGDVVTQSSTEPITVTTSPSSTSTSKLTTGANNMTMSKAVTSTLGVKRTAKPTISIHAVIKNMHPNKKQRILKANAIDEDKTVYRTYKIKSDTRTKSKAKDPIMDQVASELVNEMKGDTLGPNQFIKAIPILKNHESRSTRKPSPRTVDYKSLFPKAGSTLRIHLQKSTKFSFPLSENNAFCFLNPKSPLCGTLIGK